MQYHALALAVNAGEVDLVGLEGASLPPAMLAETRLHVHRLPDRAFASRASGGVRRFVFGSAARAVGQAWSLLVTLMRLPRPDLVLVQTPPAVPTLAVAWMVARLRGARFVIDWHNLAHTIVAIRLGDTHRAVKALARSERRWAARADAHLAVSQALAAWLGREYGIRATVVYDRPVRALATIAPDRVTDLWHRLAAQGAVPETRVPLVVCPTSWTPDEDFDLLLDALERAERALTPAPEAPRAPVLCVILTGRGALRESFETRLGRRRLNAIMVRTAWLEPADYPAAIGAADVGLCLHQSSSGLDLPMKLADFRGAGVPACAFDYAPVLGEALTPGREGVTFRDPGGLADLLVALARHTVSPDSPLARSRAWLAANPAESWEDHWRATAFDTMKHSYAADC